MKCKNCEHNEENHFDLHKEGSIIDYGCIETEECDCKLFIPSEKEPWICSLCGTLNHDVDVCQCQENKGCGKLITKREKMYPDRDDMNDWGISTGYICKEERLCPSCLKLNTHLVENGSNSSPVSL